MAKIDAQIVEIPNLENHHSHLYAQIVIPLFLPQFIQTADADYLIAESTLLFLPPNCPHKYRSEIGNRALLINVPNTLIKKTDMNNLNEGIHMPIDENIQRLIQVIIHEIEEYPESTSVNFLFFFLYDKIVEKRTSKSIEYISKHYEESIHIADLAEIEHYNVNYYREWFKKQTGMRPKEYIQKLRIEKAKELLASTEYSISKIANQVGYDYSSSFLRAFKTVEGITPNHYRKLGS